jgi:hypothetical protein
MTEPLPVRFGRAGDAQPNSKAGSTPLRSTFGRRVRPLPNALSFRLARLEAVMSELHMIIGDPLFEHVSIAKLERSDPPAITLPAASGGLLRVEVDDQTGLFVLLHDDASDGTGSVLVTASEECLIDHVLSHLVSKDGVGSRREMDAGIDLLVGQTLDVAVHLIVLRTIRHFRGSRHRAAAALDITPAELRARLRTALQWSASQSNPQVQE